MTEQTDFARLLSEATLAEDVVPVCLKGHLAAEYQELDRQLAEATEAVKVAEAADSLGDGGAHAAVAEITEQLEAVRQKMAAATVPFKLRALSDRAYSDFLKLHPPRPDDRGDMIAGFNRETMGRALVRACLVDPDPSAEQWEHMQDVLNTAEWARLDRSATNLNFNEVSIPFSRAALKNLRSSAPE